jgi:iron complex outermembrane receptor protein
MRCAGKGVLAAVALAATMVMAPAWAQSGDGTVKGIVRDAVKNPVAGATVTATSAATRAVQTATTGADGSYALALPAGSYSVQASAPRFWGPTHTVDVVAGQESVMDFSLLPMMTEVVTVTATKRESDPIDVPTSVEAHTEEDLRNRGAEDIEGVAANVASFSVQNLGPGQSQVAMRGVSSGQIARDQPGVKEQVGIYLDESSVSMSLFTPDLDLVDVGRVEVLRGPQGTLFGAGSETGTVRYISNAPLLALTEGFVDFGGAGVEDGSGTGNLKAAVNVPLGEKAAARVVGYYTQAGGATDAVQPDLSVDQDVNDGSRKGARVAVTLAPTEKLTITPRLVSQRVETNGWNLQDEFNILANPFTTSRPAVTFDDRQEFTQIDEELKDDFTLGDLNIRYDFGSVVLTSITSYIDRRIRIVRDTTALTASFTGGNIGLPEPIYTLASPLYDNTDATSWTQELRLSGAKERLQWLGGVFFMNADRDYGQNVTVPGLNAATTPGPGFAAPGALAPLDTLYFSQFEYDLDQWALFGEATMQLTDKFSLTAGLRYYDYKENKKQFLDGQFSGNPNYPTGVLSIPGAVEADGIAPRLIGTWKLSDDAVFNAQVSEGFRLGGINDPLNIPLCSPEDLSTFGGHDTWEDEKTRNYEVGYKTRKLAGNSFLNVALFYMDIHDLQTTVTAGTCSSRVVFNVPHARSQGVELEYVMAPSRNFDLSFSGSYNDADLRSTLTSTDTLGNVSIVSGIEEGRRLPAVPEVQGAVSAIYRFEVGKGSQMYVTGTWQYIGSRFTQVGDEDLGTLDMTTLPNTIGGPLTQSTFTYDPKLPAYDILNLRVGLKWDTWDISLYANNALNELALLSLDRERGTLARVGYLTNQPRTVGIATRFSF